MEPSQYKPSQEDYIPLNLTDYYMHMTRSKFTLSPPGSVKYIFTIGEAAWSTNASRLRSKKGQRLGQKTSITISNKLISYYDIWGQRLAQPLPPKIIPRYGYITDGSTGFLPQPLPPF